MSPCPPGGDVSRRDVLAGGGLLAAASLLGGCAAFASAPSTPEQLRLTSSQALEAIRSGRLPAQAYVATLLARAKALADLHAIIALNESGALAAAARIDAERAAARALPPLAGLPIVVEDNINTRELPTTAGTPALRGARPKANAPSLQKLLDAGAILLAKSNLHELAFGVTGTNFSPFAGTIENPYDRTRIPGGASGGTAAAIAARIAPAGLGTDTGGGVRIPAALCGIAGLRPSVGNGGAQRRYHDENGMVPISHTRDTIGPMARTVQGVALLDAVISGTPRVDAAEPRQLRIGIPASFWEGLDRSLEFVMTTARARLSAAGVSFVDADLPGLRELNAKVSSPLLLHEPLAGLPAYLAATGVHGVDVAGIARQIASPDVRTTFGAIVDDAFGEAYIAAIKLYRPQMQQLYVDYFAEHRVDAMMFPTTILPAAKIDAVNGSGQVSINGAAPVDAFAAYVRNTDPGSNAGIPGLSLPAGLTAAGLPVGLALDGPLGSDARLLAVGLAFEAVLGSVPAPKP